MIKALVEYSLRLRGVVLILSLIALVYGFYVASRAKLDVFPDFVPPQVVVQTEAPGFAPEQVETRVTRPIEIAVSGLGNLESLRSESIEGLSIITAVFREGTDVFFARQQLSERLAELANQMPAGVKAPRMAPLTSSTMDLLKIGLVSTNLSSMELRSFADWTIRPRLLAVPGVAKCSVFGGDVRQLQIQVRPDRLLAFNLSISDVVAAARVATGVVGAGFIETDNQRITLQTDGQLLAPEQLARVVVMPGTNGLSVQLGDVAKVVVAPEPKFGDALVQGRPGILLTMSSQYGANTMEVTTALEEALEELKPVLASQGIELFDRLHRPATFIETALKNIRSSLLWGAILVSVVLVLFLSNLRTALISLTAIPLSLLTAIVVMDKWGLTLNTITLGGLAIAIGEVVDDAVIDVENIFRRLRENNHLAQPRSAFRVILSASLEVRTAVVYATFVVVLVFVPVLTLTGLQGKFFAPLALSYILAILASLLVALTVTPAMCYWLAPSPKAVEREPLLQRWMKSGYSWGLGVVNRYPVIALLAVGVIALVALSRGRELGMAFLPEFREGHFVLQVNAAPGTSLKETLRIGGQVSRGLLAMPEVATVEQQVGRAELGEDPWGPHRSELHVELKSGGPAFDEEAIAERIRKMLGKIPGIQFEVLTFLGDRIGETLTGETAPVVVNLYGTDLDVLDEKAKELAAVLQQTPGAADVLVKAPPGTPVLAVRLRPERLPQLGLRPVEILEAIQTAYQGAIITQTYEKERVTDVTVILDPESRRDPETVGGLVLKSVAGRRVLLSDVADVYLTSGRHTILHDGGRRRQTVTCNPSGRDISEFVADAKKRVSGRVVFPAGVYAVFSGTEQAARSARDELVLHSGVAGVGILLLLSVVLRHWRNLVLVLLNLPFALMGGVIAVWLTHRFGSGDAGNLSLGSLVGFVTLFGITTRNSIMLISHYEHLVGEEGQPWTLETSIRGAAERLIPILMTALVTALGLLPLALGAGDAGREIEGPMAVVILGGLVTSTFLNLLVLPALAWQFGKFGAKSEGL